MHLTDGTAARPARPPRHPLDRRRAPARRRRCPATTVGEFGDPLWDGGPRAREPGRHRHAGDRRRGRDRDARLGHRACRASRRRCGACRLVTADGRRRRDRRGRSRDLLRAAQVAVGMLGVITELELEVAPAYRLRERIEHWTLGRGAGRASTSWSRATATSRSSGCRRRTRRRSTGSAAPGRRDDRHVLREDLRRGAGRRPGRRDAPAAASAAATASTRRSSSRTSTSSSTSCRSSAAAEALEAMRELMLARLPRVGVPAGGAHRRPPTTRTSRTATAATTSSSRVSGMPGTDYDRYLRDVDRLLGEFDARVHWGKLHFLTREQLLRPLPARRRLHRRSAASSTRTASSSTTTCDRSSR